MNIKHFTNTAILFIILITTCFAGQGSMKEDKTVKEFRQFLKHYEAVVEPLSRDAATAYFNATISGKTEDYDKSAALSVKLSKLYSNKEDFAKLKEFKESGKIKDELLSRQLETIYLAYLGNQADEKLLEQIISLGTAIENKFSTFRAEVGGRKLTDNQIEEILKTSKDSKELEEAWRASKKIGVVVSADILKLVKMRNELAHSLGFKNYHQMSLQLSEQDPEEISRIFDELDNLTRGTFSTLKAQMDEYLAKQDGVSKTELMPWHYQNRYFQEAPRIYSVDLDSYYKGKDIAAVTKEYYKGIGLPVDAIMAKSDLYEKEGKYQHAYCTTIERNRDVRVVMNIKPNYNWMGTSLHEFGHGIYDYNIDQKLPWQLREPAHTFTTEAIAMLFGRFASNPQWLKDVIGISEQEKNKISEESFNSLRLEQLVFSRWVQVVYRFEKSMYENPDQDLNKLWWDLVEKYQMVKRPADRNEPDWASKIHIASYPCYYHNYMLGELLASQLHYYIATNILKAQDTANQSYKGKKEVGEYLRKNIFAPGRRFLWNDMIERATGEKLTAKYYAQQFVK